MKRIDLNKFKTPFVILTVAPPLCGKTTYLSKLDTSNVVIISRDSIMLELHHNDNYDEAYNSVDPKEINELLDKRVREAKKAGKNIILDMMNLSSKRRKGYLGMFNSKKVKYTKIALVFDVPNMKELLKRNEKRKLEENKTFTKEILEHLIGNLKPIKEDEGFDKVITIK